MARILYGIQGDAGGHVSRALSVAELLHGHEILFVGAGQAAKARDAGYAFEELPLIGMLVRDNKVRIAPTVANFARRWATKNGSIRRLQEIVRSFDPTLILTDNEFFTPRAARALGRPCLSLDHQHVLSRTRYVTPPGQALGRLAATTLMRCFLSGIHSHLIVSFHQPPLIDPQNDALFGVLPRSDALALVALARTYAPIASPGQAPHGQASRYQPSLAQASQAQPPRDDRQAVMYLPGCDPHKIVALFGKRRRPFRVYGLGERPARGNVRFCASGREAFLQDLASAAYVVCCGGHGLLTEALLFGKPCLCFPGAGLYEQYWNCYFLREKGYGDFYTSFAIDPRLLDDFEAALGTRAARIAAQSHDGREALQKYLETLL